MVLSTPDGGRQLGIVVNLGDRTPDRFVNVFIRSFRELGDKLLAERERLNGRLPPQAG